MAPLPTWFLAFVQWLGVTSAVPCAMLVIMALVVPIFPYDVGRLHLDLLRLLASDISEALETGDPTVSERNSLRKTRNEVLHAIVCLARDVSSTDAHLFVSINSLFRGSEVEHELVPSLLVHREEQHRQARARFRSHLEARSPVTAGRFREFWIAKEQTRVISFALRHEGTQAARIVLARAASDVTGGSVVGLILGIALWYLFSRLQGDFVAAIGYGVTLGAFCGLIATAGFFFQRLFLVDPTSKRRVVANGVAVYLMIEAMLVLTYLAPSWWPLSKR
jgi:hypothetical protein